MGPSSSMGPIGAKDAPSRVGRLYKYPEIERRQAKSGLVSFV